MQLTYTVYAADGQGRPVGKALTCFVGRLALVEAEQWMAAQGGRLVAIPSQQ